MLLVKFNVSIWHNYVHLKINLNINNSNEYLLSEIDKWLKNINIYTIRKRGICVRIEIANNREDGRADFCFKILDINKIIKLCQNMTLLK